MNLTEQQRANLQEAARLARQAMDLIALVVAGSVGLVHEECLGGAVWRLTDAAGLTAEAAGSTYLGGQVPTGRGFVIVDTYAEARRRP